MRQNVWQVACGIGIIALFLRLVYLGQVDRHPLLLVPVDQAKQYVDMALHMLHGGSGDVAASKEPLYPRLLVALEAKASAARVGQAVLGALSCALLWLIGRAVFAPAIALAAGLMAAVYGPLVYFTGQLLPATVAVFLSLSMLLALLWADGRASPWRFLPAGLLLGLAILCGPQALVFVPLGAGWIWLRAENWLAVVAFAAGVLVACVPFWGAWELMLEDVGMALYNLGLFWRGTEWMPGTDPYFGRDESGLMAVLMWQQGLAFPFGIAAPLALVGLGYRLFFGERQRAENLLLLFVGGSMAGTLIFGATAASRLPAVMGLLLWACAGAAELGRRWRVWSQWRPGVAALVVLSIGLNTVGGEVVGRGGQRYWLGYAYQELGMEANALREYQRAVEAGVDFAESYYALGALYGGKDEHGKAIGAYRTLLARWPEEARAREMLGACHMSAGQPVEAAAVYRSLLDRGGDPTTWLGRLADAQSLSGDLQAAAQAYGELLALHPDSSRAQYQLARMHEAQGRAGPAIAAYTELLGKGAWAREAALRLANLLIEIDRRRGELGSERAEGWWKKAGLVEEEDMHVAEKLLKGALVERPNSIADLWALGKLLFWQGRYQEALACVAKLGELVPADYRVHFFLSKLHGLMGGEEQAMAAFEKYQWKKRRAELDERVKTERDVLLNQVSGEKP